MMSRKTVSTKRLSKEKPGVDLLILGFAPGIQLDIIAQNSSNHSPNHKEFLVEASRELGASVQHLGVPMAAGYRLNRGSALLLGIPVSEVEKTSGRGGLSAILTASFHGRPSIVPTAFVQILACLDLVIADVCKVPYTNPGATALALTHRLQHDDTDEFRRDLSNVTENVSALFSQLLFRSVSKRMAKMRSGYRVRQNGSTFNYCEGEIHYSLCQLVMEQLYLTNKNQIGYYSKIGTRNAVPNGMIGAHRFIGNGIVVSTSIESSSAKSPLSY